MIVLPASIDFHRYAALTAAPISALDVACDACQSRRLQGHGSYFRKAFVDRTGAVVPLCIRRVRCLDCGHAPSIVPAFAASGLHAEDAAVEDIVAGYLHDPQATYRVIATALGVVHATVWRWVGRLGRGVLAPLVAMLVAARPDDSPLGWLPKLVRGVDRKARSDERRTLLVDALQVLVAARRVGEVALAGLAIERPPTVAVALGVLPHTGWNPL